MNFKSRKLPDHLNPKHKLDQTLYYEIFKKNGDQCWSETAHLLYASLNQHLSSTTAIVQFYRLHSERSGISDAQMISCYTETKKHFGFILHKQ